MKIMVTIGIIIALFMAVPNVMAIEKVKVENPMTMQALVLGGAIDGKVAFYQKRLYLVDSEFKILSDIGKDAISKIRFLKANRQILIDNMITENIQLTKSKLNAFLGSKMNAIGTTMEAYSSE